MYEEEEQMKKIMKILLMLSFCFSMIGITNVGAVSKTVTKTYTNYGTLTGKITVEKVASIKSKQIDLYTKIGKKCSKVGASFSVKRYSTGAHITSGLFRYNSNATTYNESVAFLSGDICDTIYNNKCTFYGTHEFRDTTSGVVYTSVAL